MKSLKVYGFSGYRSKMAVACGNGRKQTREIVCTSSWKKAAELSGYPVSAIRAYGSVTGNAFEIELARKYPDVVLYTAIDSRKMWWRADTNEVVT